MFSEDFAATTKLICVIFLADPLEAPEERVHPVRVSDLHSRGAQGDLQVREFPELSGTFPRPGGRCPETGKRVFRTF